MLKPYKISVWDVEELAAYLCDKKEEYENDELEDLENIFYEKFDLGIIEFTKILEYLLPTIQMDRSELTGEVRAGFADDMCYIVKMRR